MTFLIDLRVDRLNQINQSNKRMTKSKQKILIRKSNMVGFQIQDDKKLILEKNLIRKSKMLILGIDDHNHQNKMTDYLKNWPFCSDDFSLWNCSV